MHTISRRILVLGAGSVSSPFIEYHARNPGTSLTVVSCLNVDVQGLAKRYENTTPVVLDVERSQDRLDNLVQAHDVVISLLPHEYHPMVAALCIKHKKNMVIPGYVLSPMRELNERAIEAGITIVQEVGLDPGIDHLLAMECIDSIKEEGGKVESLLSHCGGLPAPEASENPLRYKFSWSPEGALRLVLNGARYYRNGEIVEIEPGKVLDDIKPLDMFSGFNLEVYPNRDSTLYSQSYNIADAHTMMRGTIRYHGFAPVCKGLLKLGLFGQSQYPADKVGKLSSWRNLMNLQMGTSTLSEKDLGIIVHDKLHLDDLAFKGIKELGLLSEEEVRIEQTPFDTLLGHLTKKLEFGQGERDLVLLRIQIGALKSNGQREQHDISLVRYGNPNGYSAMAETVGIPTAIAADMVLNGEILQKGNITPLEKGIYTPMLKRIQAENICWRKKITEL